MHFMSLKGLNWCICGACWPVLSQLVLSMHVTSALLQSWLDWWVLSCVCVCVNICESTDLCRGLFMFFGGADCLQSQRVPIVAIPFISVSLLWLVLCWLVATVDWLLWKGSWPSRWVYSECLDTSFLYKWIPSNCFKHVHTQISLM